MIEFPAGFPVPVAWDLTAGGGDGGDCHFGCLRAYPRWLHHFVVELILDPCCRPNVMSPAGVRRGSAIRCLIIPLLCSWADPKSPLFFQAVAGSIIDGKSCMRRIRRLQFRRRWIAPQSRAREQPKVAMKPIGFWVATVHQRANRGTVLYVAPSCLLG